MRPLFLVLLLPLLLAFGGCAKTGSPSGGGLTPEQTQGIFLSSLGTAASAAPLWVDVFEQQGKVAGCTAMAAVGLVAPTLQDSLGMVYAHEPVSEFPAVAGDASGCGLPEVEVLDQAELQVYLDASFGTFLGLVESFGPQLQPIDCGAWAATMSAGVYAQALAPALLQVPETWQIAVPAYLVDYSACSAG